MAVSEHDLVVRHVGEDDAPWVDTGTGVDLKLVRVDLDLGTWVIRNRFRPGVQLQRHKHTGAVEGYTLTGRWNYLEYDFVSEAGSYIHEPAGSIHTLNVPEDNVEDTDVLFVIEGALLNLTPDGAGRKRGRRRLYGRGVPGAVRGGRLGPPLGPDLQLTATVGARGTRQAGRHVVYKLRPGTELASRLVDPELYSSRPVSSLRPAAGPGAGGLERGTRGSGRSRATPRSSRSRATPRPSVPSAASSSTRSGLTTSPRRRSCTPTHPSTPATGGSCSPGSGPRWCARLSPSSAPGPGALVESDGRR